MRIILDRHPRNRIMDMLDSLNLMSIKQGLHFNLYIFLWKIVNKGPPLNFIAVFLLPSQKFIVTIPGPQVNIHILSYLNN